ncbi:MAG TPA: alkaline phosphatase D family protein, partial [Bacteroidota bacterium]|nr:alkaline phosphatase D family protein [Bacteroidota bacterium]
ILLLIIAVCGPGAPAQSRKLTNGIIVGGVTETSARFWVRLNGADLVDIVLSTDSSFTVRVQGIADSTRAARNFATIISASGLLPDTRYFYRPEVGGTLLPIGGSFRTFPVKGTPATFSFGFGSCQQSGGLLPSGTPEGNIFREVVRYSPRFFLQIGDWGYPDTTDNLPFDSTFFSGDYARVQSSYLAKFRPDYPMDSLLRTTPVDYVYDDHDFMNNNSSALTSSFTIANKPNQFSSDYVVREIANPPGARENSIRGYKENMPGYPLANDSRGIYHAFSYGSADFFVVDLRSQRSPNLEPFTKNPANGKYQFTPSPGHSILGRDAAPGSGESQLAWLLNGLQNSKATWKFIVSSVPFNQGLLQVMTLSLAFQDITINYPELPPATALIGASFEVADKWIGFPADGDTLLHFVSAHSIKNVIVLSGDMHTAGLDDGANAGFPEIMAGGLDITNSQIVKFLADAGVNIWNKGGQGLTTQVFDNAFGNVTVFGRDSVRLDLVDELGTTFATHTVASAITSVRNSAAKEGPAVTSLSQNYPNPFNPVTTISYTLAARSAVSLMVFNTLGQKVSTLVNEIQDPGTHSIRFDGSRLAGGVYFYRIQAGAYAESKKLILLK